MTYSKADEVYQKLKAMRAAKQQLPAPPTRSSVLPAAVSNSKIMAKVKELWRNLKYDWKYGSRTPEKPAGFLTRAFKKAVILTAGTSVLALGISLTAGNWTERTYRSVFRSNPFTLSLTTDEPRAEDKVAPLYQGSQETMRIISMQEDLMTLGYPMSDCGANGKFLQQEKVALNWFRSSLGMPASDFADGRTLRLLHDQAEKRRELQGEFGGQSRHQTVLRKSFVNPSLGEKMRIRNVQADLIQLGYTVGACSMNGVMTDQVVAAVTQFQEKQPGVLLPNGEVDYKTAQLLQDDARKSMADSGQLTAARAQGLDDFSAVVNGQQMSGDELHATAVKYVKRGAPEYVVQAVLDATENAGFDFDYLMQVASHESGYTPWVAADSSTAAGTFQFTNGTWVNVFGAYGEKYGYGNLSHKISGGHINADAKESKYIMDLRNDPKLSALMAIEFSKANMQYLQDTVGGPIGKTELYLAHFLGGGGSSKFITEFRRDNTQAAVKFFPKEAEANKTIFYDGNGHARSLGDIYAGFARRFPGGQALRMVPPHTTRLTAAAPRPKQTFG